MPDRKRRQESGSWIRRLYRLSGKRRHREECPDCDTRESNCDNRRLTIAPGVRASIHDDGLALLNISTGQVFLSNRTGSRIWQGVAAGLSADAISDEISRDCGVRCELVRRHTSSFIFELERRGLVIRMVA